MTKKARKKCVIKNNEMHETTKPKKNSSAGRKKKASKIPSHIMGYNILNTATGSKRNGNSIKPRLGVKVPSKILISQIVSKQELMNAVLERHKQRNTQKVYGSNTLFAKKLTKVLTNRIVSLVKNSATPPKSEANSSKMQNSEFPAILDGNKENVEENICHVADKIENVPKTIQSNIKKQEQQPKIKKRQGNLEKQLALKQLGELNLDRENSKTRTTSTATYNRNVKSSSMEKPDVKKVKPIQEELAIKKSTNQPKIFNLSGKTDDSETVPPSPQETIVPVSSTNIDDKEPKIKTKYTKKRKHIDELPATSELKKSLTTYNKNAESSSMEKPDVKKVKFIQWKLAIKKSVKQPEILNLSDKTVEPETVQPSPQKTIVSVSSTYIDDKEPKIKANVPFETYTRKGTHIEELPATSELKKLYNTFNKNAESNSMEKPDVKKVNFIQEKLAIKKSATETKILNLSEKTVEPETVPPSPQKIIVPISTTNIDDKEPKIKANVPFETYTRKGTHIDELPAILESKKPLTTYNKNAECSSMAKPDVKKVKLIQEKLAIKKSATETKILNLSEKTVEPETVPPSPQKIIVPISSTNIDDKEPKIKANVPFETYTIKETHIEELPATSELKKPYNTFNKNAESSSMEKPVVKKVNLIQEKLAIKKSATETKILNLSEKTGEPETVPPSPQKIIVPISTTNIDDKEPKVKANVPFETYTRKGTHIEELPATSELKKPLTNNKIKVSIKTDIFTVTDMTKSSRTIKQKLFWDLHESPALLTEVEKLLMNEGAVNKLNEGKNTDEQNVNKQKKKKSNVISQEKAQKQSSIIRHSSDSFSSEGEEKPRTSAINKNNVTQRIIRIKIVSPVTEPQKNKETVEKTRDVEKKLKMNEEFAKKSSKLIETDNINENFMEIRHDSLIVRKRSNFTEIIILHNDKKVLLNGEVMDAICLVLIEASEDSDCNAVLITSSGNSFCHGLDYKALICDKEQTRKAIAKEMAIKVREFLKCLASFPKILVCGVQGDVEGFGVMMLLLFDDIIASDTATFTTQYARLGCVPEGSSILTLPHLMHNVFVSELLYTSRKLIAAEALRIGLVTRVLWPDKFEEELSSTIKMIAKQSSQFMLPDKKILRQNMLCNLDVALKLETDVLVKHWTSNECQKNFSLYC